MPASFPSPAAGSSAGGDEEPESLHPVDRDPPRPAAAQQADDTVRLTCKGLAQLPGAKDQVELPAMLRFMYQGKTIELQPGGKGKIMTRGCASHIQRKVLTWSMKVDLAVEDVL